MPRRPPSRPLWRPYAALCAVAAVLGLLGGVALPWAGWFEAGERAELAFARAVVGWGRPLPERADLVFVGLDDVSANLLEMSGLEEWEIASSPALESMSFGKPFGREVWAALGERLLGAGADAVVFDMVFPHETPGDAEFKAFLDGHAGRVVIGGEFVRVSGEGRVRAEMWTFKVPAASVLQPGGEGDARLGSVTFWSRIDERVWDAAPRVQLDRRAPGAGYVPLAMRALEQAGRDFEYPVDAGALGMRFPAAPPEPLPLYSVLWDETWHRNYGSGEFFRGKIVVVGGASNIEDDRDDVLTPAGTLRGPQVHLSAIGNALEGDFFRWAAPPLRAALILLGAGCALVLVSLARRPVAGLLALFSVAALYAVAAVWVYNAGLMLTGVFPIGTFLFAGTLCFGAQLARERREKRLLRRALDRYVAPELSDEILASPDDFLESLGGRRLTVTVLFSDLRGFTSKCEHADEREIVAQLNEYLEAMVACVHAHGGMVDKFIGDAVMAVWGAVRPGGDLGVDARAAAACACEMTGRLAALNAKWRSEGRLELAVGIGVHQGPAVFGNIGSAAKTELTVIGDTVNLASRIEGMTKERGEAVLLSGAVAAQIDAAQLPLRRLGEFTPRGREAAVELWAPAGLDDLPPGMTCGAPSPRLA